MVMNVHITQNAHGSSVSQLDARRPQAKVCATIVMESPEKTHRRERRVFHLNSLCELGGKSCFCGELVID